MGSRSSSAGGGGGAKGEWASQRHAREQHQPHPNFCGRRLVRYTPCTGAGGSGGGGQRDCPHACRKPRVRRLQRAPYPQARPHMHPVKAQGREGWLASAMGAPAARVAAGERDHLPAISLSPTAAGTSLLSLTSPLTLSECHAFTHAAAPRSQATQAPAQTGLDGRRARTRTRRPPALTTW